MEKFGNYKKTRLKFSKGAVLLSSLLFGIVVTALANVVLAFVRKTAYDLIPSGVITLQSLDFHFDYRTVIDLSTVFEYLISGAIIGAAVGLVIGVIRLTASSAAESRSNKKAADIRASLEPVRHIITEGFSVASKRVPAISGKKSKKGTLFITPTTLEFYNANYTKADKNFLIKLSNIISVRPKSLFSNKIIVTTAAAVYTFKVAIGTAKKWKKRIMNEVAIASTHRSFNKA